MAELAEADVFTRRQDTGSREPELSQYGSLVNAATPTAMRVPRWDIIPFDLEDTGPGPGCLCEGERVVIGSMQPPYTAQLGEIEASWKRYLELPSTDWDRVASLTRATNPTSTPSASPRSIAKPPKLGTDMRGEEITLAEARALALQVLKDAKDDLRRERAEEARFVTGFWEDDDT